MQNSLLWGLTDEKKTRRKNFKWNNGEDNLNIAVPQRGKNVLYYFNVASQLKRFSNVNDKNINSPNHFLNRHMQNA